MKKRRRKIANSSKRSKAIVLKFWCHQRVWLCQRSARGHVQLVRARRPAEHSTRLWSLASGRWDRKSSTKTSVSKMVLELPIPRWPRVRKLNKINPHWILLKCCPCDLSRLNSLFPHLSTNKRQKTFSALAKKGFAERLAFKNTKLPIKSAKFRQIILTVRNEHAQALETSVFRQFPEMLRDNTSAFFFIHSRTCACTAENKCDKCNFVDKTLAMARLFRFFRLRLPHRGPAKTVGSAWKFWPVGPAQNGRME